MDFAPVMPTTRFFWAKSFNQGSSVPKVHQLAPAHFFDETIDSLVHRRRCFGSCRVEPFLVGMLEQHGVYHVIIHSVRALPPSEASLLVTLKLGFATVDGLPVLGLRISGTEAIVGSTSRSGFSCQKPQ